MTDFLQVLPQITRTIKNTIFEVLTAVLLKIQVLWNVMLCCQVSSYQQNNRLQGQAVQEFTLKVKALHIFWQSEYLLSWTYTWAVTESDSRFDSNMTSYKLFPAPGYTRESVNTMRVGLSQCLFSILYFHLWWEKLKFNCPAIPLLFHTVPITKWGIYHILG